MTVQAIQIVSLGVAVLIAFTALLALRYLPAGRRGSEVQPTLAGAVDMNILQYTMGQLQEMQQRLEHREKELIREIKERDARIQLLEEQVKELRKQIEMLTATVPDTITRYGSGFSILGIWPETGKFHITEERDAIYNAGFDYIPLYDEKATRAGIIEQMRVGRISVIEVGAHGTKEGVVLYDGLAEPGWWARILKRYPVDLIVLMVCDSADVGRALTRESVPYSVSVMADIEDQYAIRFVTTFYGGLADNMPVTEAFEDARLAVPLEVSEQIVLNISEERQRQLERRKKGVYRDQLE